MKTTMKITETASKMLKRAIAEPVLAGLAKTMDAQNQFTIGEIRRFNRGAGPYPVGQHRLGHRSGRWSGSLNAPPAVVTGSKVASTIGSNIVYARIHEFGGVIVPKKAKALRFKIGGSWITTNKVIMPARAPITTGIQKRKPNYEKAVSASIIATLRGLGYK